MWREVCRGKQTRGSEEDAPKSVCSLGWVWENGSLPEGVQLLAYHAYTCLPTAHCLSLGLEQGCPFM